MIQYTKNNEVYVHYYLVVVPEKSALCVVLDTSKANPAIDMLTFTRY